MKVLFNIAGVCMLSLTLASCVTPKLPTSGVATIYDGKWSGNLYGETLACKGITAEFEVRYGQYVGDLYYQGRRTADFWGEISSTGNLIAKGKVGINEGSSKIKFTENTATGIWVSNHCKGTAEFKKI